MCLLLLLLAKIFHFLFSFGHCLHGGSIPNISSFLVPLQVLVHSGSLPIIFISSSPTIGLGVSTIVSTYRPFSIATQSSHDMSSLPMAMLVAQHVPIQACPYANACACACATAYAYASVCAYVSPCTYIFIPTYFCAIYDRWNTHLMQTYGIDYKETFSLVVKAYTILLCFLSLSCLVGRLVKLISITHFLMETLKKMFSCNSYQVFSINSILIMCESFPSLSII